MKIAKVALAALVGLTVAANAAESKEALIKEGEKIFTTKWIGNCTACHDANGKKLKSPGTLGPKLIGLKYWDDKTLYDTIYDIYKARGLKNSAMPPFGVNGVLSDHQIKALVAYLKTIE